MSAVPEIDAVPGTAAVRRDVVNVLRVASVASWRRCRAGVNRCLAQVRWAHWGGRRNRPVRRVGTPPVSYSSCSASRPSAWPKR